MTPWWSLQHVVSTRNGTTVAVLALNDTVVILKTRVTARIKNALKCVSPVASVSKASHVTTVPVNASTRKNASLHHSVQRTKN